MIGNERGNTLPELLVVLVLIGMLVGVAYSFDTLSARLWREGRAVVEAHQTLRLARAVISRDIRGARQVEVGAGWLRLECGDGVVNYEVVGDRLIRGSDDVQRVLLNGVGMFGGEMAGGLVTMRMEMTGEHGEQVVVWHVAVRTR